MAVIRLAVLDVDGTLKRAESPYQYLHERLGVAHLAAENRELALSGRISYGEWLRRDALLWAGQPVAKIRRLLAENPYLPGAPELLRALKRAGVAVALVSAGFTLNTDPIAAEFGLHHVLANELTIADGVWTAARSITCPRAAKPRSPVASWHGSASRPSRRWRPAIPAATWSFSTAPACASPSIQNPPRCAPAPTPSSSRT